MSDREEKNKCTKCGAEIIKMIKGPMGDREEVEVCDCTTVAPKVGPKTWGSE